MFPQEKNIRILPNINHYKSIFVLKFCRISTSRMIAWNPKQWIPWTCRLTRSLGNLWSLWCWIPNLWIPNLWIRKSPCLLSLNHQTPSPLKSRLMDCSMAHPLGFQTQLRQCHHHRCHAKLPRSNASKSSWKWSGESSAQKNNTLLLMFLQGWSQWYKYVWILQLKIKQIPSSSQ